MARLTKRLGKGYWNVSHKGTTYKRKVNRAVVGSNIVRSVKIKGKKVSV